MVRLIEGSELLAGAARALGLGAEPEAFFLGQTVAAYTASRIREADGELMRVLHFFKTYMPDSMVGIEQSYNISYAKSGVAEGIESQVLDLSRNAEPAQLQAGESSRSTGPN